MWWHFDFKFSVCDLFVFSLWKLSGTSFYHKSSPPPAPQQCALLLVIYLSGLFQIRETYFSLLTHFLMLILWYFSLHHFICFLYLVLLLLTYWIHRLNLYWKKMLLSVPIIFLSCFFKWCPILHVLDFPLAFYLS